VNTVAKAGNHDIRTMCTGTTLPQTPRRCARRVPDSVGTECSAVRRGTLHQTDDDKRRPAKRDPDLLGHRHSPVAPPLGTRSTRPRYYSCRCC